MNGYLRLASVVVLVATLGGTSYVLGQPIASSTFDTDDEGWMVVSDGDPPHYAPPHWSDVGGPSGGFIYDTDMDGGSWGFQAPQEFLGDVSAAYGHELTFDFFADKIGPEPEHQKVRVALSDPAGIGILVEVPSPLPAGQVAHREITLDDSEEWFTFDYFSGQVGPLATPAEIQAVLGNLGYLFLGAEMWDGYDQPEENPPVVGELVAYDNVILVPEPAGLSLLALGGLLVTRRRR
ncbi:MAG: PEP-CTERM sorting domain-containing protein [Phycisphaerales bacterium]|nr:MAG: PEP-CTERM sorting domain-containing protein [Phycisphaerales bacterium]